VSDLAAPGAPVRPTLKRRFDNASLRWQARMDSEWADRVVPWAVAVVLFVVLVALALAQARSLGGGVDLGAYTQGAWLIGEGVEPRVTVTDGTHLLSQQAAFLFYPIAWLTDLTPIIATLLVVQSAALALGAVPVWRIGRRLANLKPGAAGALVWAYGLYPAVHNLNLADFHPETLAVPALLFAALYGLSGRWVFYGLACAVAVAARADLSMVVFGMGLLLLMEGKRRPGLISAAVGLGYAIVAVSVVQPNVGDGEYAHIDTFAEYGTTPLGVLWGMLTSPLQVLGDLVVEENFAVVVFLLAPVFFLPVLALRYLLPVLPLQFLYLVADVETASTFGEQTVAFAAFVFVATAFALAKIGRQGVERVLVDRRVLGALVLVAAVFFVLDAASSPYREPWTWGGRDAAAHARLDAVDLVEDDWAVRASPSLVPLLAERREVYVLDTTGRPDIRGAISRVPVRADDRGRTGRVGSEPVDVIVFDERAAVGWTENERRVFREGLERQGYERVFGTQGIEVYRRAEPEAG
jgi:uncharacterized membrane protein